MVLFFVILIGYAVYLGNGKSWGEPDNRQTKSELVINNKNDVGSDGYKTISYDLPETLTFAGEPVPLENFDVRERLDREIHINTYWHNHTIFLIKRANRWFPQIEKILEKHGIPEDFKYLALIESGLENQVSYAGAVGFWQILKGTARDFGMEVNSMVDERYDPLKSTEVACLYLKKAYEKFGDWAIVAASYNRGMRGIERLLENQKVSSYYDLYLNDETARYVFRILAIKEIVGNPRKYGFEIPEKHLYQEIPLKTVKIEESVDDLVLFAHDLGITYRTLKVHNPWLRKQYLNIRRPGKTYNIKVPLSARETGDREVVVASSKGTEKESDLMQ